MVSSGVATLRDSTDVGTPISVARIMKPNANAHGEDVAWWLDDREHMSTTRDDDALADLRWVAVLRVRKRFLTGAGKNIVVTEFKWIGGAEM